MDLQTVLNLSCDLILLLGTPTSQMTLNNKLFWFLSSISLIMMLMLKSRFKNVLQIMFSHWFPYKESWNTCVWKLVQVNLENEQIFNFYLDMFISLLNGDVTPLRCFSDLLNLSSEAIPGQFPSIFAIADYLSKIYIFCGTWYGFWGI